MPAFAAQTAPDPSKVRATRQRAMLAAKIARDGEIVTITRRNDVSGQGPYSQTVPALVKMLKMVPDEITVEGLEQVGQAEPVQFTFEGGWDIQEATDKVVWPAGGPSRRIAHLRKHSVEGQITGIYATTLRE